MGRRLSRAQVRDFQDFIWSFYEQNGRDLPWRRDVSPYAVFVSEVMLQQTQVSRVLPKYESFLKQFPDFSRLAAASQADVLRAWKGLGYNRRARFLQQSAREIVQTHDGIVPDDPVALGKLPGIGPATACSIIVFAYDRPLPFIETNIRSVYIDRFFPGSQEVTDQQLVPLVEQMLDTRAPRRWFWALMDYGAYLKRNRSNPSLRSKHHVRQAAFDGSRRQLRGRIIGLLSEGEQELSGIKSHITDERLEETLKDLERERLIQCKSGRYRLHE